MRRPNSRLRGFLVDANGVSAVEFAILLPMLLTLMFSGFAVTKTVAISRKITITTRALADLTSQYITMSLSDITTVTNASSQIIAPFDATPLGMRISEIKLDSALKATVVWSKAFGPNMTQLTWGSTFSQLPPSMPLSPNSYFIYAETAYTYTPPFGTTIVGQISLGDRIYMLPRLSANVNYTGT